MAKVTSPLQSYDASGQIGKMAVHFNWKGIHAIRTYVIPTNPKTAAQITVRGYFTQSVAFWHGTQTTEDENAAWKRWIERIRKPWTALNCYVSLRVAALTKGHAFPELKSHTDRGTTSTSILFSIDGEGVEALTFRAYYGLTMTYTPNYQAGVWNDAEQRWDFTLSPCTPNTNYYYYVKCMTVDNDAQTGLFKKKTLAA